MKLNVLVVALAATALGTLTAQAETVIEEKRNPAVVIEHDHPAAVTGEKKVIKKETTGVGCDSKTVHKEGLEGSKTVTKTNCD